MGDSLTNLLIFSYEVRSDGSLAILDDQPIINAAYIMTYDWGSVDGPPMAVAPINEVRRVIEYAVSAIPSNKIRMGIPLYGYDWTLPFVPGETLATPIRPHAAVELASQYNASIEYDYVAQTPYFMYYDEQGREHIVWFEDARSIQAKFNSVKEFNLSGFFYWALGFELLQNWLLIDDNFIVIKRLD